MGSFLSLWQLIFILFTILTVFLVPRPHIRHSTSNQRLFVDDHQKLVAFIFFHYFFSFSVIKRVKYIIGVIVGHLLFDRGFVHVWFRSWA